MWPIPTPFRRALDKILKLNGVNGALLAEDGALRVEISQMDDDLHESVMAVGKSYMVPVQIRLVEDVAYAPIQVAGALGDKPVAPPEEVAADVDGALKLKRIRGTTRGRPVIGWRYGKHEVRQGTKLKFSKDSCLKWTMGRTLMVKPGAGATVTALSSRRPIVFISMGEYDDIELPVHMLGHVTEVDTDGSPVIESTGMSPYMQELFGL